MRKLLCIREARLTLETCELDNHGTHVIERLHFRSDDGSPIRGILARPAAADRPLPAILYGHAHGDRYDIGAGELVEGRPALLDPPGPAFARQGYVTFCIDMPVFGERAATSESAASKAALWHGGTLFGQMLGEQSGALTWLAQRNDVDPRRVGMTGISMGATLTYFVAAVDRRIAAIAHLCCYADFRTLIETGAHDRHGHYLTIPGLLKETSTGEIAGMVAPRPQLICVGTEDPLTPPVAVRRAFAATAAAYERAAAAPALSLISEQGIGHNETPSMRRAVLDFFRMHL
ncbi:alpha/beta hydrolase family protein [Rhizobiaceae sp. 2RAB30]